MPSIECNEDVWCRSQYNSGKLKYLNAAFVSFAYNGLNELQGMKQNIFFLIMGM
jgi:hypothetical protein